MVTFMTACKDFFGFHPNQKPIEFGKEMLALTNADRQEIAAGLKKNGIDIDPASIDRKGV